MAALQYDLRRDGCGWTVFDRWTGMPVVVSGAAQTGMTWLEAEDLIQRLSRRGRGDDRRILQ